MATGDKWFDCENKDVSLEQAARLLFYDDGNGNPVLHTNQAGTSLQPFFTCNRSQSINFESALRDAIRIDANGKPYLQTDET